MTVEQQVDASESTLTIEQRQRVEALHAARRVLQAVTLVSQGSVDDIALVTVAEWILDVPPVKIAKAVEAGTRPHAKACALEVIHSGDCKDSDGAVIKDVSGMKWQMIVDYLRKQKLTGDPYTHATNLCTLLGIEQGF